MVERHKIKGLLSPKGEFFWAVFLLVAVPLIPLPLELFISKRLAASTVFLFATLYTVSHAFTVQRFWVLLVGTLCAALLLFCFGEVTAATAYSQSSAHGGATTLNTSFTDFMYYVSFGIVAFFGYHQARFRWTLHVTESESFFEFRPPSLGESAEAR